MVPDVGFLSEQALARTEQASMSAVGELLGDGLTGEEKRRRRRLHGGRRRTIDSEVVLPELRFGAGDQIRVPAGLRSASPRATLNLELTWS